MNREAITFFFPPSLPFRDYVELCHALIETLREAGHVTGIFYGGGTSEKDALSRPFDIRTVEGLLETFRKKGKNYEIDPIFRMPLWAPELSPHGITFYNNTVPSRHWLCFELEMQNPDDATRARIQDWAAGLVRSGQFDGLVTDQEIDTDDQLIRSMYWQGRPVDLSGLDAKERHAMFLDYLRKVREPA